MRTDRPGRVDRLATVFVVVALVLLDALPGWAYGLVVPIAAVVLLARTRTPVEVDRRDLVAIGVIFAIVVGSFRLAFVGFGTDHIPGLFLSFAVGLIAGVAGPAIYTVAMRGRPLGDLGLRIRPVRATVGLALVFAGTQFAITLWGYDLPAPIDWVPLLAMSVVVGFFEAIFFRGFVQERLEASLGPAAGVLGAAAVYAVYHVGYGMPPSELLFLFGLGVTYAMAYRTRHSVFVLWPLLTPLGALYNNLEAGDLAGELPWASIMGFADVAVVMVLVLLWARRRSRRQRRPPAPPQPRRTTRLSSARSLAVRPNRIASGA